MFENNSTFEKEIFTGPSTKPAPHLNLKITPLCSVLPEAYPNNILQ